MNGAKWTLVVVPIAVLKIGSGVSGFFFGEPLVDSVEPIREAIYLAHIVVFAAVAALLMFGGRADVRAQALGIACLLVASTFADQLLLRWSAVLPAWAPDPLLLGHVQVEAFLPFFFWVFASDFPRVPLLGWGRRFLRGATQISLVAGVILLLVNLAYGGFLVWEWFPGLFSALATFSRYEDWSLYHPVTFLLMTPVLPFLIWKGRRALIQERRRIRLLVAALVIGSGPMLIAVMVMTVSSVAREFFNRTAVFNVTQIVVYAGLLSIPFTTAYAVLVQGALDVKLVIRKAVRYVLARYTVLAATATPFGALALLLFLNRDRSLAQLLSGAVGIALIAAGILGLVTLRMRTRLVARIDRRFFREQYDAHRILHDLVDGSRRVKSLDALAELVMREVDRALHVQSVSFMTRAVDSDVLLPCSPGARPLGLGSHLAVALRSEAGPQEIDLSHPNAMVDSLPDDDRHWLADGGFRLLVPFVGSKGELVGVLALGEKRSELPFTGEDRMLLATLASSMISTFDDYIQAASGGQARLEAEPSAAECERCGLLSPATVTKCPRCATDTSPSSVPLVLSGKFQIEERIGVGGMGVVYRAEDINLGRSVAIKTLPKVAPSLAMHLRREARAMAAVSHPNLAMIFGAEFWHGTPMLVFEYLAGGNLADRLIKAPLSTEAAIECGVTLASVAERIHGAGILHRDIKPRNIGFSADGTMKLLDFGLARTIEASRSVPDESFSGSWATQKQFGGEDLVSSLTDQTGGAIVGTVGYMSPEVIDGREPDQSSDIWSICVVMYEAIAGTNPLQGATTQETIYRIIQTNIPDIREFAPECPSAVAEFFNDALSRDRKRRPSTGRALRRRLVGLRLERREHGLVGTDAGSS